MSPEFFQSNKEFKVRALSKYDKEFREPDNEAPT